MEKGKLLSTPILDIPGEIGPFFFKEFFFVFLGSSFLFFLVLLLSLFMQISGFVLMGVPGIFLLSVSLLRFVFIKKIDSPWYIHKWVAYQWILPKSIRATSFPNRPFSLCFLNNKK